MQEPGGAVSFEEVTTPFEAIPFLALRRRVGREIGWPMDHTGRVTT